MSKISAVVADAMRRGGEAVPGADVACDNSASKDDLAVIKRKLKELYSDFYDLTENMTGDDYGGGEAAYDRVNQMFEKLVDQMNALRFGGR